MIFISKTTETPAGIGCGRGSEAPVRIPVLPLLEDFFFFKKIKLFGLSFLNWNKRVMTGAPFTGLLLGSNWVSGPGP
jgi:hypothetical protein